MWYWTDVNVLEMPLFIESPFGYDRWCISRNYADDMVALYNSIEGLQNTLDLMYDYCQTWKLTVNLAKINVLVCKYAEHPKMEDVWTGSGVIKSLTTVIYINI